MRCAVHSGRCGVRCTASGACTAPAGGAHRRIECAPPPDDAAHRPHRDARTRCTALDVQHRVRYPSSSGCTACSAHPLTAWAEHALPLDQVRYPAHFPLTTPAGASEQTVVKGVCDRGACPRCRAHGGRHRGEHGSGLHRQPVRTGVESTVSRHVPEWSPPGGRCAREWSPPGGRAGCTASDVVHRAPDAEHRAVHSVDDALHRHPSQAFECRIRDRARASRRAAALPMRFCRGRGRRDWAP